MKRTNNKYEKHPKEEVPWLVLVAQDRDDKTQIPPEHGWIGQLTPKEARDELLFRFQKLVASLLNICMTGRVWLRSDHQKAFLRMFASASVDFNVVAMRLKLGLAEYSKQELFHAGQVAILQAIEATRENLAGTIVVKLHDLIEELEGEKKVNFLELDPQLIDTTDIFRETELQMFLESLEDDDWQMANDILAGEPVKEISPSLREKFIEFYGQPIL